MDRYNTVEITEERMLRKYPKITVTPNNMPIPSAQTVQSTKEYETRYSEKD